MAIIVFGHKDYVRSLLELSDSGSLLRGPEQRPDFRGLENCPLLLVSGLSPWCWSPVPGAWLVVTGADSWSLVLIPAPWPSSWSQSLGPEPCSSGPAWSVPLRWFLVTGPWSTGRMVSWSHEPMVPWSHCPMVTWSHDPMGLWSYGHYGFLAPWSHGTKGTPVSRPPTAIRRAGLARRLA